MKPEMGFGRCGLACCLCSENTTCAGCDSGNCPDTDWCENRRCSIEHGVAHCAECTEECTRGMLGKMKPYAFTQFLKEHGEQELLKCLQRNEQLGVVYHRQGIFGDYDDFDDVQQLLQFIASGKRHID